MRCLSIDKGYDHVLFHSQNKFSNCTEPRALNLVFGDISEQRVGLVILIGSGTGAIISFIIASLLCTAHH